MKKQRYHFSKTSNARLDTCAPELQIISRVLVADYDITVVCGVRNQKDQDKAFREGKSKVQWPDSKHNVLHYTHKSQAVDIAPYVAGKGIQWDVKSMSFMAGRFMQIAAQMGIEIRWGGDWDQDQDLKDQRFEDLG